MPSPGFSFSPFGGGFVDEVAVELVGVPDADRGLAVDGVVFRRLEVVFDPVLGDGDLVLGRVGAGLVVVRVHHEPLQVLAVSRAVVSLEPVLEAAVALVPVPVDAEAGDAVLDRPLDLPVDCLGVAFVEPAEERLALGAGRGDYVPFRHLLGAGIVDRGYLDVALRRLRLRDVRERRLGASCEADRRGQQPHFRFHLHAHSFLFGCLKSMKGYYNPCRPEFSIRNIAFRRS